MSSRDPLRRSNSTMDSRLNLSKLASGESELSDRLPMLSSSLSKNGIMGFEEMMNNSFSTIQVSLTPSRLDQYSPPVRSTTKSSPKVVPFPKPKSSTGSSPKMKSRGRSNTLEEEGELIEDDRFGDGSKLKSKESLLEILGNSTPPRTTTPSFLSSSSKRSSSKDTTLKRASSTQSSSLSLPRSFSEMKASITSTDMNKLPSSSSFMSSGSSYNGGDQSGNLVSSKDGNSLQTERKVNSHLANLFNEEPPSSAIQDSNLFQTRRRSSGDDVKPKPKGFKGFLSKVTGKLPEGSNLSGPVRSGSMSSVPEASSRNFVIPSSGLPSPAENDTPLPPTASPIEMSSSTLAISPVQKSPSLISNNLDQPIITVSRSSRALPSPPTSETSEFSSPIHSALSTPTTTPPPRESVLKPLLSSAIDLTPPRAIKTKPIILEPRINSDQVKILRRGKPNGTMIGSVDDSVITTRKAAQSRTSLNIGAAALGATVASASIITLAGRARTHTIGNDSSIKRSPISEKRTSGTLNYISSGSPASPPRHVLPVEIPPYSPNKATLRSYSPSLKTNATPPPILREKSTRRQKPLDLLLSPFDHALDPLSALRRKMAECKNTAECLVLVDILIDLTKEESIDTPRSIVLMRELQESTAEKIQNRNSFESQERKVVEIKIRTLDESVDQSSDNEALLVEYLLG